MGFTRFIKSFHLKKYGLVWCAPHSAPLIRAANNYWYSNSGFSYDVVENGNVLLEGNYFESTTVPNKHDAETVGAIIVPSSSTQSACKSALGRNCVENSLAKSGTLTGNRNSAALTNSKKVASYYHLTSPQKLSTNSQNYGVGILSSK